MSLTYAWYFWQDDDAAAGIGAIGRCMTPQLIRAPRSRAGQSLRASAKAAVSLTALFAAALLLPAQVTVFSHATVIDGTGRAPLLDAAIAVEHGRILDIGPASRFNGLALASRRAQVIDLSGKTIIPGVINLHAHIGEDTATKLRTLALCGVTSVVGLGGDGDEVLRIRDAQRHGDIRGARIYTVQQRFEFEADAPTPNAARAKVDELARKNVDAIKIVVDDRRHKVTKLKPEIARAVIEQSHSHHLKVFAHVYTYADAKFLLDNGVDILAHQVRDREVDEAFLAEMRRKGVTVTSTLAGSQSFYIYADSPAWLNDPFFLKYAPSQRVVRAQTEFKERQSQDPAAAYNRDDFIIAAKNLNKMVNGGVRMGFGNDDGNAPTRFEGFWEHLEMELMAANAGMTPMQVIQAWSKTNSEALGVDKDYGTLAKGKVADFVVLDKSPLDSILNTRTIDAVYIGGKKFE